VVKVAEECIFTSEFITLKAFFFTLDDSPLKLLILVAWLATSISNPKF